MTDPLSLDSFVFKTGALDAQGNITLTGNVFSAKNVHNPVWLEHFRAMVSSGVVEPWPEVRGDPPEDHVVVSVTVTGERVSCGKRGAQLRIVVNSPVVRGQRIVDCDVVMFDDGGHTGVFLSLCRLNGLDVPAPFSIPFYDV